MARRYSGGLTIDLGLLDAGQIGVAVYKVRVCVRNRRLNCWDGELTYALREFAADSPESYDSAARLAVFIAPFSWRQLAERVHDATGRLVQATGVRRRPHGPLVDPHPKKHKAKTFFQDATRGASRISTPRHRAAR